MDPEQISRRRFMQQCGAGVAAATLAGCATLSHSTEPYAMTVTGPVPASQLGTVLSHEHVVVDFIGAENVTRTRYDQGDVITTALPQLQAARQLGVRTLVECTPNYIGRDPALLKRLSVASGLQILTNTGLYGAVGNRYLPPYAHTETADQLAARWVREWREGIEETGIRPGFIKSGTEAGKLSPLHEKLMRAAARTHRQSGLPIAVHTGDGVAAWDEWRIFREEGVKPGGNIWVHAQNDSGPIQAELAAQGVWISLDGLSAKNLDRYLGMVLKLREAGLLHRILLSHDDGWSIQGKPPGHNLELFGNGNAQPYHTLFAEFIPLLKRSGLKDAEVHQLLVLNPRQAWSLRPVG